MDKILIGKITSPHGVKGNVKLLSLTQPKEEIFDYKNIFDKKNQKVNIKRIGNLNNDFFITQFNEVNDRNLAETLRNTELFIDKSELKQNNTNEFYIADLINLTVININNEAEKGIIIDIPNYGANDMLEIQWEDNSIETIPFIEQYIIKIDLENKMVFINKPEYI